MTRLACLAVASTAFAACGVELAGPHIIRVALYHDAGSSKSVGAVENVLAASRCGEGRVLCFTTHPEKSDGMKDVLYRGVLWAGR